MPTIKITIDSDKNTQLLTKMLHQNPRQAKTASHKQKVSKRASRIKLEFDKELEALSGTILFPEKLAMANKFLSK